MKDILGRLAFVIWLIFGAVFIIGGLIGNMNLWFISLIGFASPLVLGLIYAVVRWIIKGEE